MLIRIETEQEFPNLDTYCSQSWVKPHEEAVRAVVARIVALVLAAKPNEKTEAWAVALDYDVTERQQCGAVADGSGARITIDSSYVWFLLYRELLEAKNEKDR